MTQNLQSDPLVAQVILQAADLVGENDYLSSKLKCTLANLPVETTMYSGQGGWQLKDFGKDPE